MFTVARIILPCRLGREKKWNASTKQRSTNNARVAVHTPWRKAQLRPCHSVKDRVLFVYTKCRSSDRRFIVQSIHIFCTLLGRPPQLRFRWCRRSRSRHLTRAKPRWGHIGRGMQLEFGTQKGTWNHRRCTEQVRPETRTPKAAFRYDHDRCDHLRQLSQNKRHNGQDGW